MTGTAATIRLLADAPEAIAALAEAFHRDAFAHPDDRSIADVAERLRPCCRRDGLPLALVALDGSRVLGTVSLRWESIASRPLLGPWAAALYVMPDARGRGIGAALVRAAEGEARRLGLGVLYAGTSTAESLLVRLGWAVLERIQHAGAPLAICRRELPAAS